MYFIYNISIFVPTSQVGDDEPIFIKHLEQYLAHSKHYRSVTNWINWISLTGNTILKWMRMCTSNELLNSVVLFFLEARNVSVAEMSIKRLKDLYGIYHIPLPDLATSSASTSATIGCSTPTSWIVLAWLGPTELAAVLSCHPRALVCSNLSKPKA